MRSVAVIWTLACFTLACFAPAARAQLEGTLFTQPEEREYLDYLREEFLRTSAENGFDIEETEIPQIPEGEVVTQSGPTELSFGGIMARRDGSRSVWLNGRLLDEGELPEGMSLDAGERSASLRIAYEGSTYMLRPGQSVNLDTGTVIENFQRPEPAVAIAAPDSSAQPEASASAEAQQDPSSADAETETDADVETATDSAPQDNQASAAVGGNDETSADADAIAAAVGELDDEQAEAFFEALQARRLERGAAAEEPNDEADDEEP